jgi:hypothetical protein
VVDVDGRLKTAQASATRLRSLMAEAKSTADVVSLESELVKRESEVESLQGRLRVLTAQVDLATINLHLTERAGPAVTKDLPGPLRAMRAGWVVLVNTVLALVAVAAFLVPFLPLLLMARWLLRRRRPRDVIMEG